MTSFSECIFYIQAVTNLSWEIYIVIVGSLGCEKSLTVLFIIIYINVFIYQCFYHHSSINFGTIIMNSFLTQKRFRNKLVTQFSYSLQLACSQNEVEVVPSLRDIRLLLLNIKQSMRFVQIWHSQQRKFKVHESHKHCYRNDFVSLQGYHFVNLLVTTDPKIQLVCIISQSEDIHLILLFDTNFLYQMSRHKCASLNLCLASIFINQYTHDIYNLQYNIESTAQMFNYMGCTEEMVEDGVKQFGLATGARKMIDSEYEHAEQSLKTGIYITYWNEQKKSECSRLGKHSKCFCGHKMDGHADSYFGKKFSTACKQCACKKFMFVPTRPEECGMYWLVRRKDFNVNTWRPPCKCKHTTEQHNCNYPLKCKKCGCYEFQSNFACLTCDGLWEHHEVLYEKGDERKMLKKKIGEEYLPLSTHKNIQQEVFKNQKYRMISNKSLPSKKQQKLMDEKHKLLNPKQPSKQQQAKLKSPLGFIIKPRYPDFMKKN